MSRQLSDYSIDELRQLKAGFCESNMDRNDLFYRRMSDINEAITRAYLKRDDPERKHKN